MTGQTSSSPHRAPLTGRRVFHMLLGFFGFIVVVNGVFVYFAFESWPGLDTDDAYRKGLAYNKTLNAAQRQNELAWRSDAVFVQREHQSGILRVRLNNPQSKGLVGLDVFVQLIRPTNKKFDQTIALLHGGDGLYQAPVTLPLKGRWHAIIEARDRGQTKYRMTHELMVK